MDNFGKSYAQISLPSTKDDNGKTAYQHAIANSHRDTAAALLAHCNTARQARKNNNRKRNRKNRNKGKKNRNKKNRNKNSNKRGAAAGRLSCQQITTDGLDIKTFLTAATSGSVAKVAMMLDQFDGYAGVFDKNGTTALMHAVKANKTEVAEMLLDNDLDIDAR